MQDGENAIFGIINVKVTFFLFGTKFLRKFRLDQDLQEDLLKMQVHFYTQTLIVFLSAHEIQNKNNKKHPCVPMCDKLGHNKMRHVLMLKYQRRTSCMLSIELIFLEKISKVHDSLWAWVVEFPVKEQRNYSAHLL